MINDQRLHNDHAQEEADIRTGADETPRLNICSLGTVGR